jgi:hypothetical protein
LAEIAEITRFPQNPVAHQTNWGKLPVAASIDRWSGNPTSKGPRS